MTPQWLVTKFRGLKEQVVLKVVDPRQISYIILTIFKGISHVSETLLNDFLPPSPPTPSFPLKVSSVGQLFTCNCAHATLALPVDGQGPPAPSPLSSILGPKQPTVTRFVTNGHLFQPMQFHCCSLCVNVRTDTCITDTTDSLEHKRTPSRGWSGLLMSKPQLNLCLWLLLLGAKPCGKNSWNWWRMWKNRGLGWWESSSEEDFGSCDKVSVFCLLYSV